MNFLNDEGEARVRDAYPGPTCDRLAAVKRRYEPTNLFRLNQNIPRRAPHPVRTTQRNPRWEVPVSTGWAMRAAGR